MLDLTPEKTKNSDTCPEFAETTDKFKDCFATGVTILSLCREKKILQSEEIDRAPNSDTDAENHAII